ncbi:hypothetical protein pipiens_009908 [Culex pipiens pipiens]|uniref:Uncharacterized protein n=1 Tax=Culex pipiens pipiens TaxID=38569 RepID=A0ABD1DCF4_CULPP
MFFTVAVVISMVYVIFAILLSIHFAPTDFRTLHAKAQRFSLHLRHGLDGSAGSVLEGLVFYRKFSPVSQTSY